MTLQGRLDALARKALEAGYLTNAKRCPTCGWPAPRVARFVSLRVERAQCLQCRQYVDNDGRALGGVRTVFVLESITLELPGGRRLTL